MQFFIAIFTLNRLPSLVIKIFFFLWWNKNSEKTETFTIIRNECYKIHCVYMDLSVYVTECSIFEI